MVAVTPFYTEVATTKANNDVVQCGGVNCR